MTTARGVVSFLSPCVSEGCRGTPRMAAVAVYPDKICVFWSIFCAAAGLISLAVNAWRSPGGVSAARAPPRHPPLHCWWPVAHYFSANWQGAGGGGGAPSGLPLDPDALPCSGGRTRVVARASAQLGTISTEPSNSLYLQRFPQF